MDIEDYEQASIRVNKFLDFSTIKSKTDYKRAIVNLGRTEPAFLNLLGKARGEMESGFDKLFDSSDTQTKIITKEETEEAPKPQPRKKRKRTTTKKVKKIKKRTRSKRLKKKLKKVKK